MKETTRAKRYMTVGEIAKKMDVSVRTLQHYDHAGLLNPTAISDGGRRLYTDKDVIRLHQILSLKHLGFSLSDIKNRLISLDTPQEVANVLQEQATAVREKIDKLTQSLQELELLREEVLQMRTVDFKKYADIIVNLQMHNEFYYLIKHFDDQMLEHIRNHFDKQSGRAFMKRFLSLQERAITLKKQNIPADSAEGQIFAQEYWKMIMHFTGGDLQILSKLVAFGQSENLDQQWQQKQQEANSYVEQAMNAYFSKRKDNPFQESEK